jgi:hypothetical protein
MDTDSYADVVERLFQEFDWAVSLPDITRLVSQCRQHWSGSTALEGIENEARQRLTDLSVVARPDPLGRHAITRLAPVVGPQATSSEVSQSTLAPA